MAENAQKLGKKPLARLVSQATFAHESEWFTTAPVEATRRALKKANLEVADIDLFEFNEAFAVVPIAAIKDLGLDPAKVNVNGGAIAIGHPIGCSGARILVTLAARPRATRSPLRLREHLPRRRRSHLGDRRTPGLIVQRSGVHRRRIAADENLPRGCV